MGGLEKPGRFSTPRRPAWHPAVGLGEEGGWVAPEERSSGMDRMGRYLSVRRARLRRSSPRAGRTYPFRLRSAVVSDGQVPSSVSPPTRDARGRMFDPAAVGATLGACSVQLGCFAAVRRVRKQAVSRAGARKIRGAVRHAGGPLTPAVSACSTAVRSGRSDPCHGSATAGVNTPGERRRRVPFSAPDACIWSTG
jgi:hypothetical protein